MRNLVLVFTLFTTCLFAQTGINYQGAATDADGAKLVNQNISLKTSVLQGGVDGTTSYSEIHNTTTDQFGLFNVVIGQGVSISGDFETISWGSDDHFLKVELDATGGTNYNLVSTTQMMSVPYALYAKNAGLDSAAVADMLASMNISSNHSGGCNPHYPEGLNGEGVTWNFDDGDYLVPSGKNLYITNAAFVGSMKIDDITVRYGITNDVYASVYENNLSAPIIAGQNQIVSFIGSTSNSIFNGILVDATSLQAVTIDLQTEVYTVPNNKRLFVISPFLSHEPDNLYIDDLVINTGALNLNQLMGLNNPLILNSGQEIRSELAYGTEGSINGYLVDEDYFADCGGSGGSISSTPSSLDSAMVADMIAANTSSGSGGDWELLYDELNTNNDEPYGTVNRYGIAQSDGFLYLVGSYATVYTGNDHDTITNTWPENPILQNISANDPNEAHIIPLKKNMSWHIEFHSTLGYITKGYFIPNGGLASFANGGISGTSKSFKYPEGINNDFITLSIKNSNTYIVPENKNLYITNAYSSWGSPQLLIDNKIISKGDINYNGTRFGNPIIVGSGSIIDLSSESGTEYDILEITIQGFLTNSSVTPITFSLDEESYTVPSNKTLFIASYFSGSGSPRLKINEKTISRGDFNYNSYRGFINPIVATENEVVSTDSDYDFTINGYLVDKDYFESPSSSSASNSVDGGNSDMQMTVSTFGDTLTIGNQSVIIPGISYENNTPEFGTVTDIDGNVYQTVSISGNEWMTEDLKVTKFNNGDELTYHDTSPPGNGWSYWENTPTYVSDQEVYNSSFDGVFYNGVTIQDSRNICPQGWRIPSEDDFIEIMNIFGNQIQSNFGIYFTSASSFKIQQNTSSYNYWSPSESTNSSFLSFFPTGYKPMNGGNTYDSGRCYIFLDDGERAFTLDNNDDIVFISNITYYNLYKARCVKD